MRRSKPYDLNDALQEALAEEQYLNIRKNTNRNDIKFCNFYKKAGHLLKDCRKKPTHNSSYNSISNPNSNSNSNSNPNCNYRNKN